MNIKFVIVKHVNIHCYWQQNIAVGSERADYGMMCSLKTKTRKIYLAPKIKTKMEMHSFELFIYLYNKIYKAPTKLRTLG